LLLMLLLLLLLRRLTERVHRRTCRLTDSRWLPERVCRRRLSGGLPERVGCRLAVDGLARWERGALGLLWLLCWLAERIVRRSRLWGGSESASSPCWSSEGIGLRPECCRLSESRLAKSRGGGLCRRSKRIRLRS
jgi:hypothetical protein